jgi:hypothetical protein
MILRLALAVLATWRVTHLLAAEDGPGDIIFRFRRWLGQNPVGKLIDCFNCLSLWVAAPIALFVSRTPADWFVGWLAISGGACLLQRLGREPVIVQSVPQPSEGELNHVLWSETRVADNPSLTGAAPDPELEERRFR